MEAPVKGCVLRLGHGHVLHRNLWVGYIDHPGGDLDYDDVQFSFSNIASVTELPSVPEPTTLGLFCLGLAGMAFAVNRRKKA